jgi:anti-sigma-K factor RskA
MNATADRIDPSDPQPPDDGVLAGEYVLGVLDRAQRERVQSRIAREPAFAALVEAWEERFSPWTVRVDAVAPGAQVWPRIRTQLGWSAVEPARTGLWNSVAFWRVATTLAAAAGVAAIVLLLQRPPAPAPTPPTVVVRPPAVEAPALPVTVLARDDGSTGWIARIDPANGKVLMVPVPTPADAKGRVNELWVIPEGRAPISLGKISNAQALTIDVPATLRRELAVGATLAVSLEPPTGIPHAAPTGPIVAKGGITQL